MRTLIQSILLAAALSIPLLVAEGGVKADNADQRIDNAGQVKGATRLFPGPEDCGSSNAMPGTRILVFTRTVGFRHDSIPAGVAALEMLGENHGFAVEHTEDAAVFADESLGRFSAVVCLNTLGDVLDTCQEAAFKRYIQAGGGFVGIHAAAATEPDWGWYGELVGGVFKSHPVVQSATVHIEDATHVSTACLPSTWSWTDEWYDFLAPPPAGAIILVTVDESTYEGGTMGAPHPISWYHRVHGGRAWYTAMGHTSESYSDPAFLYHVLGGILWAATRDTQQTER